MRKSGTPTRVSERVDVETQTADASESNGGVLLCPIRKYVMDRLVAEWGRTIEAAERDCIEKFKQKDGHALN